MTKELIAMGLFARKLLGLATACGVVAGMVLSPFGPTHVQAAKHYTIAFVPKFTSIQYFVTMANAGQDFCKLNNCTFTMVGPAQADAVAQVRYIKQLIAQHVDALIVAPDDPAVVAPALAQAEAQGIKTLTSDTDAPGTVRRVYVAAGLPSDIGGATIDALASAMHAQGDWAINSCSPAAQNLNSWIAVEKARALQKYPKMHLIAQIFSGEDIPKLTANTKDLITTHPTLKGIIGQCGLAAPAVAQAITDLHKVGQIVGTGVSWPGSKTVAGLRPFVKSGVVPAFAWWDVYNLGYLSAWAALQEINGTPFQAMNTVPKLGTFAYDAGTKYLIEDHLITWTKKNIDHADPMGHWIPGIYKD